MVNPTPTAKPLADRTILITGASQGIGCAVATAAAAAGAVVIACGRDVPALERLADAISAAGGPQPLLLPLNLEQATADDYATIATLIADQCGGLDGIVVNAAQLGQLAPLEHADGLTWARTFQVNVHSAFLLLQACLPLLRQSTAGRLLFTLAAEGLAAAPNWGAYAVSKYALRGLFDLCARELVDQVCVQAVVPPPTDTELRRTAFPALDPQAFAAPTAVAPHFVALLAGATATAHGEIVPLSPLPG